MLKQASSCLDVGNNDFFENEQEENNIKSIESGGIIQDRFLIQEMIGEGSFGKVFRVLDQKANNSIMAIKVEDDAEETSMLEREIKVLIEMRKKQGFPQIKFYGQERGFIYCIMGLLGRNLESLLQKCAGRFSIPTVLKLGIQVNINLQQEIFNRIEQLHTSRFIHRDIKPDNFVLGYGASINIVHIIDFGLSKYYQNSKGEHIPQCKKSGLIGTARYASVNAHQEQEQSRRDDLESIGYILIYMATGTLPWMNLQIESKELKYAQIHQFKKTIKVDELCRDLPHCFHKYMLSVKGLSFKQQPNYRELKQCFQDELDKQLALSKSQFSFDWERLPEYQQQKKHKTVHLMQTLEEAKKDDIIVNSKIDGGTSKIPNKEIKKPTIQVDKNDFNLVLEKKKLQSLKKTESPVGKQPSSPSRNKKSVKINIIEVEHSQITDDKETGIPQALQSMFEQNQFFSRQSVATSRMMNYETRSEDIESEGTLPIWNVEKSFGILSQGILSHDLNRGIKKPTVFVRKQTKAHTQVQTLKNISKTFVSPKQMNIQGDECQVDDLD